MEFRKIICFTGAAVFFSFMFSVSSPSARAGTPPRITTQIEGIEVPEGKEIILEVYTVQKTDSLVKIAQREYGDWKKWKVIYEHNEFVREPHWIFPGDKLIVPTVVAELPEVPEIEAEEPEEEVVEDPRKFKDFLAPEDFIFDAIITDFRDDKKMYAQYDYCFIDMGLADGIEEGMRFNIYRPQRRVSHPRTGHLMGTLMEKVGALRVTEDIEQRSSTARITMSHTLIEKGDSLLLAD